MKPKEIAQLGTIGADTFAELVARETAGIEAAAAAVERDAGERAPVLRLTFALAFNIESRKTSLRLRYGAASKAAAERLVPDPAQPELPIEAPPAKPRKRKAK
jgi:hypothetical protein